MFRRKHTDPRPAKTIAGQRVDAFGRKWSQPELEEIVEEPVAQRSRPPVTKARIPAPTAPRPLVQVPKTVRELAPGDRQRLWAHVASLPCQLCGRHGVQVAHSNALADGKGRSIKASEFRVAALCPECHVEIDSGKNLTKEERAARWQLAHHRTIGELFARGLVRPVY